MSHNGGYNGAAVEYSLHAGVRLYDTAARYGTEEGLGEAIRSTGINREELYISSKLWPDHAIDVATACKASRSRLGVDKLDLYLIHWPGLPGSSAKRARQETWRQMELLVDTGYCRSIGVSNFLPNHLEDVLEVLQFQFE